ncbi:MAG: sulfate adenylyltransferase subunit CysD [Sedimentisphaerales bacterium]|jgi:sulfate adenylyltransferase subunit 2|nr:sulfate adenylyltransferase subunit CysD [Sedimentisphaerales bacterium]
MDQLDLLESQSIYILRQAYRSFKDLVMLWSMGKDSTVLLWLTRKAFFGHVPLPLLHIDAGFKIPQMIEFRDNLARKLRLNLIVGKNIQPIEAKQTFPDGAVSRLECCQLLKTEALKKTLSGEWPRWILDHTTGQYIRQDGGKPFTGVIVGARVDEEASRSKERYFSCRDQHGQWDIADQPPELWDQFNTDFPPGAHVRIHPLLDWTELQIWQYIDKEKIEVVDLYFDQGNGKRYRFLGCWPCTSPVNSTARTAHQIADELAHGQFTKVAERSGRQQDKEDAGSLETLRRGGYM